MANAFIYETINTCWHQLGGIHCYSWHVH